MVNIQKNKIVVVKEGLGLVCGLDEKNRNGTTCRLEQLVEVRVRFIVVK